MSEKEKSWPIGIIIVYALFALGLLGFWYFSSLNQVEMVTENYYEKTLQYEDQITKERNTDNLKQKPIFNYTKSNHLIILKMPDEFSGKSIKGDILFFRPSDAQKDRRVNLQFDKDGKQFISVKELSPGKWKAQLEWYDGAKSFYYEEIIVI